MKIVTVVGARPQFIKAAPFSFEFRKKNIEVLVHTGQHYDTNMSDVFFEELDIPKPDYNLNVMSGNHGEQTAKMLIGIEKILLSEKPDGLLVYGDTNSTLAGALAAGKLNIPVYHIESGLRSYNRRMPEELNRILTDHISYCLLCPTLTAVENLNKEGIVDNVHFTGDIMYDSVLRNIDFAKKKYDKYKIAELLHLDKNGELKIDSTNFYLATIHRAENTDDIEKLRIIFSALNLLNKPVIMPIHPRTRKLINELNLNTINIHIIEPVNYLLMLYLTSIAHMVITDSGGLQKEAYFLKVPCTTIRDQTEWLETLKNDWNVLCGIDIDDIIKNAHRPLTCFNFEQSKSFGDGNAVIKICEIVTKEKI